MPQIAFALQFKQSLYLMNLSLILFVLSAFVAYLLYDMFKKSRQEQQILRVQNSQGQPQPNKLRPSYSSQCQILKSLHQQKSNSFKRKSVSIHLLEDTSDKVDLSPQGKQKVKETIELLSQTFNIHLIVNKNTNVTNALLNYLRQLKLQQIGYKSSEGAVAILRQLNPNIHLQSEIAQYKAVLQYLPNIWVVDGGRTGERVNQYKSECEMVTALSQIVPLNKKKEE